MKLITPIAALAKNPVREQDKEAATRPELLMFHRGLAALLPRNKERYPPHAQTANFNPYRHQITHLSGTRQQPLDHLAVVRARENTAINIIPVASPAECTEFWVIRSSYRLTWTKRRSLLTKSLASPRGLEALLPPWKGDKQISIAKEVRSAYGVALEKYAPIVQSGYVAQWEPLRGGERWHVAAAMLANVTWCPRRRIIMTPTRMFVLFVKVLLLALMVELVSAYFQGCVIAVVHRTLPNGPLITSVVLIGFGGATWLLLEKVDAAIHAVSGRVPKRIVAGLAAVVSLIISATCHFDQYGNEAAQGRLLTPRIGLHTETFGQHLPTQIKTD